MKKSISANFNYEGKKKNTTSQIDFSNQIYIILTKFKNQFFFSSQIQKFQLKAKIHFLNWIKFSIKTKNDFSYQLTFQLRPKSIFQIELTFD